MKKIIALVLVLALAVSLLAACGQENTIGEANAAASQDDGKLRIVTTIFPEYDWVREILGDQADRADLTMLLDNGVDLHSYQPTPTTSPRSPTATSSSTSAASPTSGWTTP